MRDYILDAWIEFVDWITEGSWFAVFIVLLILTGLVLVGHIVWQYL